MLSFAVLVRGEQMQNVARHTTALVKKQEQLGATMFEFGVAFTLLANVRERENVVARFVVESRVVHRCLYQEHVHFRACVGA